MVFLPTTKPKGRVLMPVTSTEDFAIEMLKIVNSEP